MADIEKAREIAKCQLAKGVPLQQIKDVMWNSGYTQAEIDAIVSDKPLVEGSCVQETPFGNRRTAVAIAALVVIIFTLPPFIFSGPFVKEKRMSIGDVTALLKKLDGKIEAEGGFRVEISTNEYWVGGLSLNGTLYKSGDKGRFEGSLYSEGIGLELPPLVLIWNNSGSYERHAEGATPYWAHARGLNLRVFEMYVPDADYYYDEGSMPCGEDVCEKIFAQTEWRKITLLCRADGFCPSLVIQSPDAYVKTIYYNNPVFGPLNESLFAIPPNEELNDWALVSNLVKSDEYF